VPSHPANFSPDVLVDQQVRIYVPYPLTERARPAHQALSAALRPAFSDGGSGQLLRCCTLTPIDAAGFSGSSLRASWQAGIPFATVVSPSISRLSNWLDSQSKPGEFKMADAPREAVD
jgi:hypothetical protein